MVPVFTASVSEEAKTEFDAPVAFKRYLRSLKGQRVEVVVRKRRSQRSIDQNSYIHAVPIPLMAAHLGYSIPDMKLLMMGECWGWHTVGNHELPVKGHTSEMTTEECAHFIEWAAEWGMVEHGVTIPLPNEVDL